MTAKDALTIILSVLKDEPAIYATGFLARTAQGVRKRPQDFYVIGSMGMVSSLAIGVAVAKPGKKVIALDGDGAVLMNLGSLATAGSLKLKNLVHIVIDNESYESTGRQPTISGAVALDKVSLSCGYRTADRVKNKTELKERLTRILKADGPAFLLVKVETDPQPASPRIEAAPEEITAAFSESLR